MWQEHVLSGLPPRKDLLPVAKSVVPVVGLFRVPGLGLGWESEARGPQGPASTSFVVFCRRLTPAVAWPGRPKAECRRAQGLGVSAGGSVIRLP